MLTEPAPSQRHLQKIAAGCTVDGVFVQPVAAVLDDSDRTKLNRVRVVVAEGRKHEVHFPQPCISLQRALQRCILMSSEATTADIC